MGWGKQSKGNEEKTQIKKKEEADGLTFKVKENYWAMLKFAASQHFQEVSHEPPGTERGEKFVGDEGMDVGVVRARVCVFVWARGAWEVKVSEAGWGGGWGGLLEWCDGSMCWVKNGDIEHRASLIPLPLVLFTVCFKEEMVLMQAAFFLFVLITLHIYYCTIWS